MFCRLIDVIVLAITNAQSVIRLFVYFLSIFITNYINCDCCCKNDLNKNQESLIINLEDVFKKEIITIDKLNKLNRNVPQNFIDKNKDRVFKMINVFKKGLNDNDIDEILMLLYNLDLNTENYRKICDVLYNKLTNDKKIIIAILKDDEDLFYIFNYKEKFENGLIFFNDFYMLESQYSNSIGCWGIEIINNVQKLLADIFYEKNIEKGINFPMDLFYKISYFLCNYINRNIYKQYEFKNEIECLLKNNKTEIDCKTDNLKDIIYLYLDEKTCIQLKNESEVNTALEEIKLQKGNILIKISHEKIEIFK